MHHTLAKPLYNRFTIANRHFYRDYPYRGGLAVDSASARDCVDFDLGIFCNRIPKAANSTVIAHLALLKFGRQIHSVEAKKLFDTPAFLSRAQMAQFDRLFKFSVVRKPFDMIGKLETLDRDLGAISARIRPGATVFYPERRSHSLQISN